MLHYATLPILLWNHVASAETQSSRERPHLYTQTSSHLSVFIPPVKSWVTHCFPFWPSPTRKQLPRVHLALGAEPTNRFATNSTVRLRRNGSAVEKNACTKQKYFWLFLVYLPLRLLLSIRRSLQPHSDFNPTTILHRTTLTPSVSNKKISC